MSIVNQRVLCLMGYHCNYSSARGVSTGGAGGPAAPPIKILGGHCPPNNLADINTDEKQ